MDDLNSSRFKIRFDETIEKPDAQIQDELEDGRRDAVCARQADREVGLALPQADGRRDAAGDALAGLQ